MADLRSFLCAFADCQTKFTAASGITITRHNETRRYCTPICAISDLLLFRGDIQRPAYGGRVTAGLAAAVGTLASIVRHGPTIFVDSVLDITIIPRRPNQ